MGRTGLTLPELHLEGVFENANRVWRMSSAFNKNRFHPVLKRVKAHLGTDYVAPTGTPIRAVGSGVVIKANSRGITATT